MPGRIRPLDRRLIRLSDAMLGKVEHLARLAGVTASDVVEYVLIEVFDGDGLSQPATAEVEAPPEPVTAPRTPPRAARPADVIPITRRSRHAPRSRVNLEALDLAYLRRSALELRRAAQQARARAAETCQRASRARAQAQAVLEAGLASL